LEISYIDKKLRDLSIEKSALFRGCVASRVKGENMPIFIIGRMEFLGSRFRND
jgi:hypothetical protein